MNTSVIVSSAQAFKALSSHDLRRSAPSVFADHARPGVSTRYTFVSTEHVVALLSAEGWEPVKATEQRVRLEARVGFQMHEIRFARRADLETGTFNVGQARAEMILQNAHDGTRAYRIDAGLYRLVCRNGLVVADADFAHVAIRHVDVSAETFAKAAQSVFSMTNLHRNVSRRTRLTYSVLFSKPAKIVVTLAVGDILIFREERRRRHWALPIDTAFFYAVRQQTDHDRAEKKARRKRPTSAD